ncbi:hypothetical protein C9J12_12000 [Photobacterium frigidiphilum]|uniref:Uncharacterized protein n=1 Tax=Photobacterium frigidiphilum TaxID=264736 RepID=A0A2T3JHA8_9GAMM|nr:hypothetical protein [Photobacterium frigidiphilum]PSU48332.1 hypothetical protein C9J12_12000 [Photobacterium frigidiphilum]
MLRQFWSENIKPYSLTRCRLFCCQNNLTTSSFYAKQQQLNVLGEQRDSSFVHAQIAKRTMQYHVATPPIANMALSIGNNR